MNVVKGRDEEWVQNAEGKGKKKRGIGKEATIYVVNHKEEIKCLIWARLCPE